LNSFAAGLVLMTALLRIWLELRQRACLVRQRGQPPPAWTDAASQQRTIDGALIRGRITLLGVIAEAAVALLFAVAGIAAMAQSELMASVPPAALAVALSVLVLLSLGAVRRGVEAANVYVVDAALGLGRPGVRLFLSDTATRIAVLSIVVAPLLVAAAALIERQVPLWWLLAWAVWLMLMTLDSALRPLVQTRLLYSAIPLPDPSLVARIEELLGRCGLKLGHVQVLDASRRTRRANASVHGLGRRKHIYLHDTLLDRLGSEEVLAVVAHEAGHARHGHVLKALAGLGMLGLCAAAGVWLMGDRLGLETPEKVPLIALLMPSLGFLVRPIVFGLSRRFEYEADAFAASHVGAPAMMRALERLYVANAGVPESDPLYAAFHASHPGPSQRLGRLTQISTGGRRACQVNTGPPT